MDFELSEDQVALAGLVRAIVAGRFPLERVRRAEEARQVVDADDWAALGEAGVFSLTLPDSEGGAGLGLADAAVVFEELGRGLVPGPLVASHLAARILGVEGAAAGTRVVGELRPPGPGEPCLAEHLDVLDALVVVDGPGPGSDPAGLDEPSGHLAVLDAPGGGPAGPGAPGSGLAVLEGGALDEVRAGARPVARSLDPLTPLSLLPEMPTVPLAGPAGGTPIGSSAAGDEGARAAGSETTGGAPVGGRTAAGRWDREARVLTGALCVGIAAATCDLAVAYAKEREQFGRPIGSFQAVKHLCADMLVRAESARAAVQAAACTVDQPGVGDTDRAAAGGALLGAEAAVANAKAAIQVHGGMGFTWEVPVHLYLMRARVLASSLGPLDALAGLVARSL